MITFKNNTNKLQLVIAEKIIHGIWILANNVLLIACLASPKNTLRAIWNISLSHLFPKYRGKSVYIGLNWLIGKKNNQKIKNNDR